MAKMDFTGATLKLFYHRDYQDKIHRRPYWHYANYKDFQKKINRRPFGFMLIIETSKLRLTGGYIGFIVFI